MNEKGKIITTDVCDYVMANFPNIMFEKKGRKGAGNYYNGMVWNFHSWNDIHIKRPDLGKEYDGWQALDSTPQESSRGLQRMGPAPLSAVKKIEYNKMTFI